MQRDDEEHNKTKKGLEVWWLQSLTPKPNSYWVSGRCSEVLCFSMLRKICRLLNDKGKQIVFGTFWNSTKKTWRTDCSKRDGEGLRRWRPLKRIRGPLQTPSAVPNLLEAFL